MPNHKIVPNIFVDLLECFDVIDTNFRKPLLPDWRPEPQFPPCSKCKPTLDELHGAFDRRIAFNSQQQIEMIGHDDEFVQAEFPFAAIFAEHPDK